MGTCINQWCDSMKSMYTTPEVRLLGSLTETTGAIGARGAGDTGYYSWGEIDLGYSEDECAVDSAGNITNPNCPF
jgi:hypothetical protein